MATTRASSRIWRSSWSLWLKSMSSIWQLRSRRHAPNIVSSRNATYREPDRRADRGGPLVGRVLEHGRHAPRHPPAAAVQLSDCVDAAVLHGLRPAYP